MRAADPFETSRLRGQASVEKISENACLILDQRNSEGPGTYLTGSRTHELNAMFQSCGELWLTNKTSF